ncbi:MAG: cobalamin B12-binding domain-containing protein [Marivibrio sp.]|uniref:cobalamin B12-binding domain-containing protein n=1 Tax=Marivibrio sp. TaxID=2039719 RepID=UPI0032EDF60F
MATTSSMTLRAAEAADLAESGAESCPRIVYSEAEHAASPPAPERRKAEARVLNRTIEDEIIPRLLNAHAAPTALSAPADGRADAFPSRAPSSLLEADDVLRFAERLVSPDADAASAYLATLRRRGLALEELFVDLMGPAARELGDAWSDDRRSFADVTLGLSRLQTMLRSLSPAFGDVGSARPAPDAQPRRILLAPTPGEQHTFGVSVVEEFFRRDGWEVVVDGAAAEGLLVSTVSLERFTVVGLSLCRDDLIGALQSAIRSIRQHSLNADVSILVGGRVFADDPTLARRIGADAHATDARDAVDNAERLIGASASV